MIIITQEMKEKEPGETAGLSKNRERALFQAGCEHTRSDFALEHFQIDWNRFAAQSA
jgi:hypothetical protein